LIVLSEKYIDKDISIADFTMYFTAVTSLDAVLSDFTRLIGKYNQQVLDISDYKKLTSLHTDKSDGVIDKTVVTNIIEINEIVFNDISFHYPGSENIVLNNINIRIKVKEKLMIAGLNGAGKSTFIKLLCKFYRPTSGKITVNGIDIWEIPNAVYYKLLAAVFQDYSGFAFTVAENVSLSEQGDKLAISGILRDLGMNSFAEHIDTYLTKTFSPEGIEPSGGEGQKLAITRAVYKNAGLLILDEPTASLDAKAEAGIYADFFNLSRDKTAVFISHRLAAAAVADNIAVFEEGKLVEYGKHDELMRQNGLYAEMYRKQSRPYIESSIL
jgi:ATP-binding cassette subfamily C protein